MGVAFCERELSWELQFQTQQTRASDHREDVHEPNALALDVPGVLPVLPEDRLTHFRVNAHQSQDEMSNVHEVTTQ
jgi:hypothetical protein